MKAVIEHIKHVDFNIEVWLENVSGSLANGISLLG